MVSVVGHKSAERSDAGRANLIWPKHHGGNSVLPVGVMVNPRRGYDACLTIPERYIRRGLALGPQ